MLDSANHGVDSAITFAALEGLPELVCVCEEDLIQWINAAGLDLLGADQLGDLVGQPFNRFLGDDYAALGLDIYPLLADEDAPVQTKMKGLDGGTHDCELSVLTHTSGQSKDGPDQYVVCARDISEFTRIAENLHLRENYLRDLINNSLNLICECRNGNIRFINQSGISLLGVDSEQDVIGKHIRDLFHSDYAEVFAAEFQEILDEDTFIPLRLKRMDGSYVDVEVAFTPMGGNNPSGSFLVEAHDITEHNRAVTELRSSIENLETRVEERTASLQKEISTRREAEKQLLYHATHDALTGLPNRSLLRDRIDAAVAGAGRHNNMTAIMFIDLDGFKAVNDTLGHDAGDELLIWIAGLLNESIRATDTAARNGGDEFVVVSTDLAGREDAETIAAKIIERLTEPMMIAGAPVTVGASIGISLCPDDSLDAEELMRGADVAMYHVKTTGKNNYCFAGDLDVTGGPA